MATETPRQKVLRLVREIGVLRPRDLDRHGLTRTYLQRLHEEGELERIGRGLYTLPDADIGEHHSLKEKLRRQAQQHGRSMAEEVREILRGAVAAEGRPKARLGSRIAGRFAGQGLEEELPEILGEEPRPAEIER